MHQRFALRGYSHKAPCVIFCTDQCKSNLNHNLTNNNEKLEVIRALSIDITHLSTQIAYYQTSTLPYRN